MDYQGVEFHGLVLLLIVWFLFHDLSFFGFALLKKMELFSIFKFIIINCS